MHGCRHLKAAGFLLAALVISEPVLGQVWPPQPARPVVSLRPGTSERVMRVIPARQAPLPVDRPLVGPVAWQPGTEGEPGVEDLPGPPAVPGQGPSLLELVEFRQVPLRDALRLFSEQTGLNVVASQNAGDTIVSTFLRSVTPMAALETLTKTHGLFYRQDPRTGIISIYTRDEFNESLASFQEEEIRVFTLLYPNAMDAAQAIADIFGDRVILGLGGNASQTFTELTERFDRFDLIDGRSQGLGLFGGGGGFGGGGFGGGGFGGGGFGGGGFGGGGFGGRGGFGGVGGIGGGGFGGARRSDLLRNSRTGRQAIDTIAEAEAETIPLENLTPEQIQALANVQRGEAEQEIIDNLIRRSQASIYVTVISRQNQLVVRTSDPRTMEQIVALIAQLDIPTPLVLLEVKILEVDLSDGFNSAFDYQFSDGSTVAGGFTSGDILPPDSDALAGAARRFASLTPAGTGLREGDLLFQVVSESFRFRMQLLESKNRVTQLATPLLLTANNEVSRLFVGEEVPLNRSFSGPQPITDGGVIGGAAFAAGSTAIEFRPVGTTLLITPSINADRSVTLRILQETSNIVQNGATVLVPTDTGFAPQDVDIVRSRTVSGTIVAKDGLSVAIGGLIDEAAQDNRSGVPVIGKLPVVGFFFRRQDTRRTRSELIVVIRPYVFNTPTESAHLSKCLLEQVSLHPNAPDPRGTLDTFAPHEVVRPNPPLNPLQTIFRFHSLEPKVY